MLIRVIRIFGQLQQRRQPQTVTRILGIHGLKFKPKRVFCCCRCKHIHIAYFDKLFYEYFIIPSVMHLP